MQSTATTPQAYLDALPEDRRPELETVLEVVRSNLQPGFEEGVFFGMIGWVVPLRVYPDTYNGAPLSYAGLAMQKRHNALYLMGLYGDKAAETRFRERWQATGRKLDMGKSCLRYRKASDLDLDLVGEAVAALSVDDFIAAYEQARAR